MSAEARDRAAQLTVRFVSQMISVTRDKTGTIVDGNPDKVADITDVWTFARDTTLSRSELEAGWHRKRGLDARLAGLELAGLAFGVIALALSIAASDAFAARHSRAHSPFASAARRRSVTCHIRSSNCRSRSTAASMRRWPGPRSPAGTTTIISPPTRRFASAASRSRRRPARRRIRRRSARRCAIPAASPRASISPTAPQAKAFFEENFLPLRISRLGEGEGFVTGYYEPVDRRLADPERSLQRAGLSPAVQPVRPRHQAEFGRIAQQGPGVPQDRPPQAGALLRPRRDRGRRDRGPRSRNLLAEGTRPICCSRRSRARRGSSSTTARPSASTTMRITAIPIRRSAAS